MPQSYDPKLGILSSFEGMGNAMSDIGKLGMVDAMETRRSKMEQELRRQLQGDAQTFEVDQSDIANTRKVAAAKTESEGKVAAAKTESEGKVAAAKKEHGYDIALEQEKAKTVRGKSAKNPPIWQKGGARRTDDEMRKAWESKLGLLNENWQGSEGGVIGMEKYANDDGWTLIDQPPPPQDPPLDESTYRQRVKESWKAQFGKDIEDSALDEMVNKNRAAGKIASAAVTPVTKTETGRFNVSADRPEGIIDVMAGDAGPAVEGDKFAGGMPQDQQGVLEEVEKEGAPLSVSALEGQESLLRKFGAGKDDVVSRFKKYQSKTPSFTSDPGGYSAEKAYNKKLETAAKKAKNAIRKGNIKQVKRDTLRFALNYPGFFDGLHERHYDAIEEYLKGKD